VLTVGRSTEQHHGRTPGGAVEKFKDDENWNFYTIILVAPGYQKI